MKKRNLVWLVLGLVIVFGGLGFDRLAAVKPVFPPERKGDLSPARPAEGDDAFSRVPLAPTFAERQQMYLNWVLTQPTPEDRGGVWTDIVKLSAGAQGVNPVALKAALEFVNKRSDPGDFTFNGLLRMYYLFKETGKLSVEEEAQIKEAILNWKYWLDEPGVTNVEMWTENHQILNHSSEYLAGQLFPDEVFKNNGQTGRWHQAHAEKLLLQWIDLRARTGFAEWDSETYYPEDIAPLINLVDFAEDPKIATLAAGLVDVLIFDTAVDSYYGQFGPSSGRITEGSIKSANGSMTTIAALAWGQGKFISTSNMGAVALATTARYEVPSVIQSLALDNPAVYTNYERDSFNIDEVEKWGLDINDVQDAPLFWGIGAFTVPPTIDLTIKTADEWNLWHYPDFSSLKDIAKILQSLRGLSLASTILDPDPNGVLMSEVNKVTYRTPDYMLSSAQSFRPGGKGYQQHIWQATLGSYAVVFTNHPDSVRSDDSQRPGYWMGNGRLPDTAQYQNVLMALYNIPRYPSAPKPLETRHYAFTHAYFPKWAFDEVVEKDNWLIGRVGDGYVALYSSLPYQWMETGPDAGQEIVALGNQAVWICQLGRASVDGTFAEFVQAITTSQVEVNGLNVRFDSPGNGEISFGWEKPLKLGGEIIQRTGYPRFNNPYTTVTFGQPRYEISFNGLSLNLDFENAVRIIK